VNSSETLAAALGLLVVGAVFTAQRRLSWRAAGYIAAVFAAASSCAVWTLAARVFASGPIDIGRQIVSFRSLNSSLRFHVDALSAVFLVIVPLVGLCAVFYSIEYMRRRYPTERPTRYYPFMLLLLASIIGVVTVSDLFFFFVFWELMTLTSYFLVVFDWESPEKVRAGLKYFVMTHVGTALMFIAAILVYSRSGSFAFAAIAAGLADMTASAPWLAHIVLALFFVGFATKAGMFPLGGWLPDAHSAAPSPVSAPLSGVIVKVGIYGIVRTFLSFLPASDACAAWGSVIATLGTASIFVGTVTALRQDDSKRVLGFHTIGQIGYVLLGIGIGVAFIRISPMISAVGLIGGLFHLINHATYKSLLFLNAGAAEYATGTRDLNKMGGLAAYMPLTAGAALVASMSIAGIPPFSGFASKWMLYHASFRSGMSGPEGGGWMTLFLVLGLVAMFVSLVTLASFLKVLGGMFFGALETNGRAIKGEVPVLMRVPQAALAAICVLFGVAPVVPLALLRPAAAAAVAPGSMPGAAELFGGSPGSLVLNFGGGHTVGLWNPTIAIVALAIACAVAYFTFHLGLAPSRRVENWYCGEQFESDLVRFRMHGFVAPFKQAFAKAYPTIPVPRVGVPRFLQKAFNPDEWFYGPLIRAGGRLTERFSHTHVGIPQMYMLWQVLGVIVVVAILYLIIR